MFPQLFIYSVLLCKLRQSVIVQLCIVTSAACNNESHLQIGPPLSRPTSALASSSIQRPKQGATYLHRLDG
ncbi:hypothetical protein AMECASPLE_001961 [Ameca splendens]|uniref:Secreted protein n=1 Tax=Ameca splendens TaxID=208324 RepID=A0ABV0XB13_9TELE